MRAQPPRRSSMVSGSPSSACVTCSEESSGAVRTGATPERQITVWFVLRRGGLEIAQRRQPGKSLALELTDPLTGQIELVPDRLQSPRLAVEAEAKLQDPALPLGQSVERAADSLLAQRLLGLVERIRRLAVGEEIAELALVVRADRLVQRDRRLGGAQRLVDVLQRQTCRVGELLLCRLAAQLDLEPARRAAELLLALDDVHGHADRARVVGDGALHRLADPPGRVSRELVATPPVELLDCAVQAERPLLDQVQERHAEAPVALCDRNDQAEVRLDHATLRGHVAALDRLRERDLFGGGQKLVASDVREEELQAVGRPDENLGLRLGDFLSLLGFRVVLLDRLANLEADRLELTLKLLGVCLAEIVLQGERLDLRRLDEAALFGALHEHAGVLGLEQLVHLVLRQFLLRLSRCCGSLDLSHCRRNLLDLLGLAATLNHLVT